MSKEFETSRWLHLSDIHLKAENSYDYDVIIRALIDKLKKDCATIKVDAIFFTGDVAFSGAKKEYILASNFFDALLSVTGCSKENLFVIPGNHDVNRDEGFGLARTLESQTESDRFFSPQRRNHHLFTKMGPFVEWFNEYFSGVIRIDNERSCVFHRRVKLGHLDACVLHVNTALFCVGGDDHGKLWVGRRGLSEAIRSAESVSSDVKITLMHHPFSWLNSEESQSVSRSIHDFSDVILRGHLHEPIAIGSASEGSGAVVLSSGAVYQTRKYKNAVFYLDVTKSDLTVTVLQYLDTPREIWTVDPAVFPYTDKFQGVFKYRQFDVALGESEGAASDQASGLSSTDNVGEIVNITDDYSFEKELFSSPLGTPIYAEPRIMSRPQYQYLYAESGEDTADTVPISVKEIVQSDSWFIIEGGVESGLTLLSKRLLKEFLSVNGVIAVSYSCDVLPNYRKKLADTFKTIIDLKHRKILLLDDFDKERDVRLIREIIDMCIFDRVIILSTMKNISHASVAMDDLIIDKFSVAFLWNAGRACIRQMARAAYDTGDELLVSQVVDKIYFDLLALCIPLTPSNVIMYLRVLNKEGKFNPINRVEIVSHYLNEELRRPGDAYIDSFNVKNKIDILGSFVYILYKSDKFQFSIRQWIDFCDEYKKEKLIEFDDMQLLADLKRARIVVEYKNTMTIKYRFFYCFLVGRHIANKSSLLDQFLRDEEYLVTSGIVGVISGLSSDNERLADVVCSKLEEYLDIFNNDYIKREFDPLIGAEWPTKKDDEEKIWKPIADEIKSGPKSPEEIDAIKTLNLDEALTTDQQVWFSKLKNMEFNIFHCTNLMFEILQSGDDISGDVKKRCVLTVFRCRKVVLQIGSLLSLRIAERKYVSWGGLLFINHKVAIHSGKIDRLRSMMHIITSLNDIVATQTSQGIGSRKLGGVFKMLAAESDFDGVVKYQNFACILSSKPAGWHSILQKYIEGTDRNAYYLLAYLRLLIFHFKHEISTAQDRDSVKWLISCINTKRKIGKESPGSKAISRVMADMEKGGYFRRL